MATIESIAEVQKSINSQLLARMAEFESQLKASPSSTVTMLRLSEDFANFKQHVWNILTLLQQQVAEVMKTVDIAETRHRRKFLLLSGVPEKQSEDLTTVILPVFHDKMQLPNIKMTSFKSVRRLGNDPDNKCRPILIRFCDEEARAVIWRKKTSLKGTNFVLAEFLTKQKQSWFITARKHLGVRNVWTQNGSIVIKLPSGGIKRIISQDELDSLLQQVPITGAGTSKSPQLAIDQTRAGPSRVKRVINKKK